MLAISILAPHGMNIATGRKTIEVRSWKPDVLPVYNLLVVENKEALLLDGQSDPNGRAVAIIDIVEVNPWLPSQVEIACSTGWEPGYWAWTIVNVRPIQSLLPTMAKRKLYEVEIEDGFQLE